MKSLAMLVLSCFASGQSRVRETGKPKSGRAQGTNIPSSIESLEDSKSASHWDGLNSNDSTPINRALFRAALTSHSHELN